MSTVVLFLPVNINSQQLLVRILSRPYPIDVWIPH